jgi:hypothetical protein
MRAMRAIPPAVSATMNGDFQKVNPRSMYTGEHGKQYVPVADREA